MEKFTLPTMVGEWSLAYKQGSWDAEIESYPTMSQQLFLRNWFLVRFPRRYAAIHYLTLPRFRPTSTKIVITPAVGSSGPLITLHPQN